MSSIKYLLALACCSFLSPAIHAQERIISTTGNASETLTLLGAADRLVAVDTTSLLPADIMAGKPKIGYRRALSAEGILSLSPDLIILAPDAGPPEAVQQIEAAGIPLLRIQDEKTQHGINADIRSIARAIARESEGEALVAELDATLQQAQTIQQSYAKKPRILLFFASHQSGGQGMGKGSPGDALIALLGGENALEIDGMKPLSTESLLTLPADVILVAELHKNLDKTAMPASVDDLPELAHAPAAQNGCLIRINVMESLGFGPSYAKAVLAISDSIAACLKP